MASNTKFRGDLAISLKFGFVLLVQCFCLWTRASSQSFKVTLGPLEEEQRSGTLVGNIATSTPISNEVSQDDFSKLTFSFLDNLSRNAHLFNINSRSGAIITQTKIDREAICEDMEVCLLEFDVTVKSEDIDYFRLVEVTINVTDMNDNEPSFKNEEIVVNVPENNMAGMVAPLPTAVDHDTRENAVQMYSLQNNNNAPFTLSVERRLNGRFSVNLVASRQLDREMIDRYKVLLKATDGGLQPLTGTLTVNINVTDENDNPPIFTHHNYAFNVQETAGVGETIGSVTARDQDVGRNKDIRYTLVFPTRDNRGPQLFGIDQYTGEVTIKRRLQYDAGKTFRAVIEARDQGVIQNLAEAELTLTVVNVGNNAPRLELKLSTSLRADTAILSEWAKNNSFVGKLDAIDNDPGASGIVECWSKHRSFKVVDYGEYFTIVLNGTLDREYAEHVDVTLVCRDKGSPPKQSSVTFYVIVEDENDNPPVFTQKTYTVNITEENFIGEQIIKLKANDADDGVRKMITYSLYPKENSVFSINPDSGWLTVNTRFDHEIEKKLNVIVLATDAGKPPLTGTATVVVNILDINDNYPELETPRLFVKEGGPKMKKVGQLVGKDRDSGRNGHLVFSMPLTNDISGQFFKVNTDGRVYAIQTLDRETKDRYQLNIEVSDQGNPPKSIAATVTIIVQDINDNPPHFHFPSPSNKSIGVKWSYPAKRTIVRVNATDADLNNSIHYYIHAGNKDGLFGLDEKDGRLFLHRKIRASDDTIHHLIIAAHDWGPEHQESKSELVVVIDVQNATFAALEGSKVEDKYILIAGIVAGITLLLSIIILVIIFVIRNGNRRRPLPPMADKAQNWHVVKTGVQEECGKGQVLESVGVGWRGSDEDIDKKGGSGSGGGSGHGHGGGDRNGEGGFSRGSQPDVTKTGNEVTFKKALVSNNTWSDGRDGYIQNHSNVGIGLDPYRKQEFYTFCKVRNSHDDVHSVTSGDTNNSDSGRGGSEDDIPLPPIAECSPELNSIHGSPKHVTEYRPITTMPSNSALRHHQNKSDYKTLPSLTSFKGPDSGSNSMYPSSHSYRSGETSLSSAISNTLPYASDKSNQPSSASRHNNQGYTSLAQISSKPMGGTGRHVTFSNRKGGGGAFSAGPTSEFILSDPGVRRSPVPPPSYDSLDKELNNLYVSVPRSVDDDDGNTTTSGSYTIDSDNLNESIIST